MILETMRYTSRFLNLPRIQFGPFNSCIQKRWKKPADTAQTRLENRTRDLKLDKLVTHLKKLETILEIKHLMDTRKRGRFVSVQLMSRWKNILGLNVGIGEFIHKYPHVFEVFSHRVKRNLCCRVTRNMRDLLREEESVMKECELDAVRRVKKLLMMSKQGRLHVQALRLIRRELGLPEDFRDAILGKYTEDFRLIDLEIVELVDGDEDLGVAEIEKWREKEYREKWLSEFETRYAFPINFPTGFRIVAGFREKLRNWHRLPYMKPYERKEVVRVRTCGGIERYEKRAVGMIHELLSLTVGKMVRAERLTHFRKDFGMEVNVREVLLKHPGIFYISTKGSSQIVFLREAYSKGHLVEPNPIYLVRRKMLDLVLLGCRNTTESRPEEKTEEKIEEGKNNLGCKVDGRGPREGDWVIPLLEGSYNGTQKNVGETSDLSEEFDEYGEMMHTEEANQL
ncbi:Ubiquitin carboxyl-terminal hydrolase family protein [Tripterygium wilfordii]|uniref:Ubiquitin carboxyl-terminal hydrolase family protein n=1 Tax=Tripterygium wilfordii TaxID=458696 RepID=A0A7J7CU46_TRIWF|nr:protein ROOT PRIMORDIUM DEFECTIVE 1 [Tripterygium wilfordii]KAF5737603.1 Ubiquitin carboxyl-terminal hydrolase family protein [Tripterygium wilfordii]